METGNSQNKSHQTEAGGSTPPQAREQQPVAQRGVKSSDAVEANTPAGGGRSRFTSIAGRVARTELPTGGALLALENRATPIVAIRASLRAGSYFEPRDKPGLARLTAEMLERGTGRRTKLQIAGELEAVGAELEFSADTFALQVSGRTLAKDFPRYLETLAEILREPSLPGEELHKLKQQTVALIQEQQANTRFRAYEKLTQVIFDPANPFFVPPGEQLVNSINSITVEDVREFYQRRYGGRSLILAVSGDVEAAQVQTRFADAFENFAGPESVDINVAGPAPQSEARREIVVLKEKASVDVMLGCAAPLRRDASDYYAALLANSALGESTLSSRLGLEVRDREGLTYGIGSRFRAPSLTAGPWYVAVSVNPQNVERAIESATNVLSDYVANGIRPDELADEKSSATGSFKVALSTNTGIAEALWNAEFYRLGADYLDRFPQLVEAVTVEEANTAIRKYFRPECLTAVIAGDYHAVGK